MNFRNIKNKKVWIFLFLLPLVILCFCFFCSPRLPKKPFSIVLEDKNGNLLGAKIAKDGQWRFELNDSISLSDKYIKALLLFEDRKYFYHPGIDPFGLARSVISNIKRKKVVSGGSTITMQVASFCNGHKAKNIWQKLVECLQALHLSAYFSKNELLNIYAEYAPFGGNTVGYTASSYRFFGKYNRELSWAEAALLAVLPNNPSLIRLDKNRVKLLSKRNRLLKKLFENKHLSKEDFELALIEPLPKSPIRIPSEAPHLLLSLEKITPLEKQSIFRSSIDIDFQQLVKQRAAYYSTQLKANEIHNLCILVGNVKTGKIISYVGNMPNTGNQHAENVDIIQSKRSSGSTLKPILTMLALSEGLISTESILSDIPINIDGFKPENFSLDYKGIVPVHQALRQSLNIPFILLLQKYNIGKCLNQFNKLGLKSLNRTAEDYGLSLIIGGGEVTMWELCQVYSSLAQIVNNASSKNSSIKEFSILNNDNIENKKLDSEYDPASIYLTFNMLKMDAAFSQNQNVGNNDQNFSWKTGTSFGFRDAWAIGVNSDFVVGVWVGNADGEGRPGVIGLETAAPILFDIFKICPKNEWFTPPISLFKSSNVCSKSGYAPSLYCPQNEITCQKKLENLPLCTFHKEVNLSHDEKFRVNSSCYDPFQMVRKSFFTLQPLQTYFYKKQHTDYIELPNFMPGCENDQANQMEFIYPLNISKIFLTKNIDGRLNPIKFELAHTNKNAIVNWYLDGYFLQQTLKTHHYSGILPQGKHLLACEDQFGVSKKIHIEIIHSDK